jgi:hypothetical protein
MAVWICIDFYLHYSWTKWIKSTRQEKWIKCTDAFLQKLTGTKNPKKCLNARQVYYVYHALHWQVDTYILFKTILDVCVREMVFQSNHFVHLSLKIQITLVIWNIFLITILERLKNKTLFLNQATLCSKKIVIFSSRHL